MLSRNQGFTLIELVIFIVVLGIVGAVILNTTLFALKYSPLEHNQTVATATATKCMELFLGQRYLNGFTFNNQNCPGGSDDNTLPSFCSTLSPSGFTTTVTISCTTVPNFTGTQAFKQIKVATTDSKAAKTVLNLLFANY